MCLALKKADSAPVPDKCPSIDKADWLICLLQTKYENITRSHGFVDKDIRNTNENIANKVSINSRIILINSVNYRCYYLCNQ